MNKGIISASCALTVLIIASFISVSFANPYISREHVSPPIGTIEPAVLIFSPINHTVLSSDSLSLVFNVSIAESQNVNMITDVYLATDWSDENMSIYHLNMQNPEHYRAWITELSRNKTLSSIPDGNHTITIVAWAWGSYNLGLAAYYFDISGYSIINFTVDTTMPQIRILEPNTNSSGTGEISLQFTVNEPLSEVTYVLDGGANVTVLGNTTLTGLSPGEHSLTVYATDETGNVGASETAYFITASPPTPTTSPTPSPVSTITPSPSPTASQPPTQKQEDNSLTVDYNLVGIIAIAVGLSIVIMVLLIKKMKK